MPPSSRPRPCPPCVPWWRVPAPPPSPCVGPVHLALLVILLLLIIIVHRLLLLLVIVILRLHGIHDGHARSFRRHELHVGVVLVRKPRDDGVLLLREHLIAGAEAGPQLVTTSATWCFLSLASPRSGGLV